MEQVMDNDFIRQVYYHSLTPIHEPIKYIPIDFALESEYGYGYGNGYGDEYGNGDGKGYGYGNGSGSEYGNGYGRGDGYGDRSRSG